MEPIFENITIETEQLLKEAIQVANRKRFRNNKIFMALGAAAFAFLGIEWHSWILILCAVAYVGLFFWQFYLPAHNAKRHMKAKLAYYDQENPPLTYRFFDDHFEVSGVDSWHTYPYRKLEGVIRLKSGILVTIRHRGGCTISLEGFQKGTPEELITFLRTKYTQPNPANWNW